MGGPGLGRGQAALPPTGCAAGSAPHGPFLRYVIPGPCAHLSLQTSGGQDHPREFPAAIRFCSPRSRPSVLAVQTAHSGLGCPPFPHSPRASGASLPALSAFSAPGGGRARVPGFWVGPEGSACRHRHGPASTGRARPRRATRTGIPGTLRVPVPWTAGHTASALLTAAAGETAPSPGAWPQHCCVRTVALCRASSPPVPGPGTRLAAAPRSV